MTTTPNVTDAKIVGNPVQMMACHGVTLEKSLLRDTWHNALAIEIRHSLASQSELAKPPSLRLWIDLAFFFSPPQRQSDMSVGNVVSHPNARAGIQGD